MTKNNNNEIRKKNDKRARVDTMTGVVHKRRALSNRLLLHSRRRCCCFLMFIGYCHNCHSLLSSSAFFFIIIHPIDFFLLSSLLYYVFFFACICMSAGDWSIQLQHQRKKFDVTVVVVKSLKPDKSQGIFFFGVPVGFYIQREREKEREIMMVHCARVPFVLVSSLLMTSNFVRSSLFWFIAVCAHAQPDCVCWGAILALYHH